MKSSELTELPLKNSKNALDHLHKECMGKNFFKPLAKKKRSLIAELNYLSDELAQVCKQTKDSGDVHLSLAIQEFNHLAFSLKDFDKKNEDKFKNAFNRLNQHINSMNQFMIADAENINPVRLLNYGENLSLSMSYLGSTVQLFFIIGYAFQITLKKAVELAGGIFYPITAVFNTVSKLFSLITSIIKITDPKEKALTQAYREEYREQANTLLRTSIAFKSLSFVLNALAIIAFVGVIANPIGWGFVAAATLIDWMEEGLGGVRKAEIAYENQKKKWDEDNHTSEYIKNELDICEANLIKARSEERWGRINVVAMILFAAAPIPVVGQVLMIAGLTAFTIASLRNIYVAVKPRIENYLRSKTDAPKEEPIEVEMVPLQRSTKVMINKLNFNNEKPVKTQMIELQTMAKTPLDNSKLFSAYDNKNSNLKKPHTHEQPRKNKSI